ncbi:MAG TPA: SDR family oxidoreductase [Burkholderiaceae bacterium]|nr:SDR family oxidoreductase [Burkholderiaceae bacterium]
MLSPTRAHPPSRQLNVVVTGASAGVGRATALQFARDGATAIGLIARDAQALQAVQAEIEQTGARALALPLDVADSAAVFGAADRFEREIGPVDVWVNNAMATVVGRVIECTPEEFRRVTEVTYLGYVHGTLAALRHMMPRDRGVIVQVGSALAYRGIPLQAAYCAAKHAIRGFTDSLRAELHHDRSRIALTAVHLPAVNTPQFDWSRTHRDKAPRPVSPVYQPQVAARAIVAAARQPQREYWLGSQTAMTVLGNMVLPGLLDRILARQAFEGQDTDTPVDDSRRDNLFDPVPGVHRTAGSFDDEARADAAVLPGPLARVGAVALAVALGVAAATLARTFGSEND